MKTNIKLFKIVLLNSTKTKLVDFLKFIRINCYFMNLKAELPNLTFSKIKMCVSFKNRSRVCSSC